MPGRRHWRKKQDKDQAMGKYAYLIICHKSDASLRYLLKSIDDERNDIYIHVDAKARDFGFDKVKASVIFMTHEGEVLLREKADGYEPPHEEDSGAYQPGTVAEVIDV